MLLLCTELPPDLLHSSPASCGYPSAEEIVETAESADDLHASSVDAVHKPASSAEHPDQPPPVRGKGKRQSGISACPARQNADKLHGAARDGPPGERVGRKQSRDLALRHNEDFSVEQKGPGKSRAEGILPDFCSDDKNPRCADIQCVEGLQRFGKHCRPESPVAADVDPAQEDDECDDREQIVSG